MRVDVVTLFPELFETFLKTSFVGRAMTGGQLTARFRSPRDFGLGKHKSVDDTPYGGGSGMVMRVDVMVACMEALDAEAEAAGLLRARRVLLTPQGTPFVQSIAARFSTTPAVMLICGRYEGFDERIRQHLATDEISLGDFVLTGGELAALAVVDAVSRLLPGVLGDPTGAQDDSHASGLLEYPHYTRPPEFRGWTVPEMLLSGDHARIARWRRQEALKRTFLRRPDMLLKLDLSEEDRVYLSQVAQEITKP